MLNLSRYTLPVILKYSISSLKSFELEYFIFECMLPFNLVHFSVIRYKMNKHLRVFLQVLFVCCTAAFPLVLLSEMFTNVKVKGFYFTSCVLSYETSLLSLVTNRKFYFLLCNFRKMWKRYVIHSYSLHDWKQQVYLLVENFSLALTLSAVCRWLVNAFVRSADVVAAFWMTSGPRFIWHMVSPVTFKVKKDILSCICSYILGSLLTNDS